MTKDEIKNRIKSLSKSGTEFFTGSEIGKPGLGVWVHLNPYHGLYEISQCGDALGHFSFAQAVDFVVRQARAE